MTKNTWDWFKFLALVLELFLFLLKSCGISWITTYCIKNNLINTTTGKHNPEKLRWYLIIMAVFDVSKANCHIIVSQNGIIIPVARTCLLPIPVNILCKCHHLFASLFSLFTGTVLMQNTFLHYYPHPHNSIWSALYKIWNIDWNILVAFCLCAL